MNEKSINLTLLGVGLISDVILPAPLQPGKPLERHADKYEIKSRSLVHKFS